MSRRIFSRIFSPDFSPHFCGKKCPEKSSRKIPGKILQNFYNKNPPTHFCRLTKWAKIVQKMPENCVFGPSAQFLDIFRTFFRQFSDILSTFRFSRLSNDLATESQTPPQQQKKRFQKPRLSPKVNVISPKVNVLSPNVNVKYF